MSPADRGLVVLVVDDNPLNLLVTRKILEQEGCTVLQAEGAQPALDRLSQTQAQAQDQPAPVQAFVWPDLILMDLHMPGVDGLEAMRRMRRQFGDSLPPVLAISGAVTAEVQAQVQAEGMVGFITKPFDRLRLLQALAPFQR